MKAAADVLTQFGIAHECRVVSAHRTPAWMVEYARDAEARGLQVIIAGAGGAAHLPGMVASMTTVPVLGVPVQSKALSGLDSLLSIVQMPGGVPVGTLAIGDGRRDERRAAGRRHARDPRPGPARAAPRVARARGPRRSVSETLERRERRCAPSCPARPSASSAAASSAACSPSPRGRLGYRVHTCSPGRATRPPARSPTSRLIAAYDDVEALRRVRARRRRRHLRVRERPVGRCGGDRRAVAPVRPAPARCSTRPSTACREKELPVTTPAARWRPFALVDSRRRPARGAGASGRPRASSRPRASATTARARRGSIAPTDALAAWDRLGRQRGGPRGVRRFRARAVGAWRARGIDGRDRALRRHREHPRAAHPRRLGRPRQRAAAGRRGTRSAIARAALEALDVVGVLCVELFLTRDGRAPRQRARAAPPQLRPPHHRRVRHQPVRAAAARGVRPAAGTPPTCCGPRRWRTCSATCGRTASRAGPTPWRGPT